MAVPAKKMGKVGDLEINQDLKFQRRMWRAEAVGRLVLLASLVAALLGFWGGGGWLSQRELSTPSGSVKARFEAFERRGSEAILGIQLARGVTEFWLDSTYLEKNHLVNIQPEPGRSHWTDGRTHFHYPASDGISAIRLEFRPRIFGSVQGRIGSAEDSVELKQWILP